jgi:hypothetical protein
MGKFEGLLMAASADVHLRHAGPLCTLLDVQGNICHAYYSDLNPFGSRCEVFLETQQ